MVKKADEQENRKWGLLRRQGIWKVWGGGGGESLEKKRPDGKGEVTERKQSIQDILV